MGGGLADGQSPVIIIPPAGEERAGATINNRVPDHGAGGVLVTAEDGSVGAQGRVLVSGQGVDAAGGFIELRPSPPLPGHLESGGAKQVGVDEHDKRRLPAGQRILGAAAFSFAIEAEPGEQLRIVVVEPGRLAAMGCAVGGDERIKIAQ